MKVSVARIAVDVMGSDKGPEELLIGVKQALERWDELPRLVLIGEEEVVKPLLRKHGIYGHEKVEVVHASQVIMMDEKPIESLKRKKDSSMVVGLEMVKRGEANALVSCGNTGSLMAGGTIKLRPMTGLERPALSSIVPSKDHHFILVDVGANPETEARQLVHNAILGSNHCEIELGVRRPKVGLLSIGTEEGKGTDKISEAHGYLKRMEGVINYTGLIEGFHVFEKDIDVVVTDGFVGNILVKTCESLFHMLKELFRNELSQNPLRKLGAGLSMGAYRSIKNKFNPDRFGAAPLLGLNGLVLKAHGSSNRNLLMYAINSAANMLKRDMNDKIRSEVMRANEIMKSLES